MKEKTAIVCSELLPARSINKEDLYEFTGTLQHNIDDEKTLNRITMVFTDMIAIGISFRTHKKITKNFLEVTPDFDFESIDELKLLTKKSDGVRKCLLAALVYSLLMYRKY